jgi:DNA-binding NarL/FixJ family response regulator
MIRILIVDDHAFVRKGLAQYLELFADLDVVGNAADGDHALALARELQPDVVLMDISMPSPTGSQLLSGIDATRSITDTLPEVKVVILTSSAERKMVLDAINAGASGYILKDREPDDIVRAVRAAAAGGSPLDPRIAPIVLTARGERVGPELSGREREVVLLVAEGLSNRAIGERLAITEKTVKSHLTRAFQRLGLKNRAGAIAWAHRMGLVDSGQGGNENPPP